MSGAASLLLARRPSLTPAEVRDVLTSTAVDGVGAAAEDTPGWDRYHGHGRLDVRAALERLRPVSTDGAPTPAFALRVYPNPSAGRVVLEVASDVGGPVVLEVFDALGRRVGSAVLEVPAAAGVREWPVPQGLAAGLYVVTATGPAGRLARTVTVQ